MELFVGGSMVEELEVDGRVMSVVVSHEPDSFGKESVVYP